MELTTLLAKVLGLYMLIGGIAVIVRKRFIMAAAAALIEEKGTRLVVSVVDIIVGLLIINVHDDWSTLTAGLITFIGWAALVKGLAGLFLKDSTLEKFMHWFRVKNLYVLDGVIGIVLGLYLANAGFGWF